MIELGAPWAFLAWPLPLLMHAIGPRFNAPMPTALTVPFFKDIADVVQGHTASAKKRAQKPYFLHFLAIWSLMLLALANPRWIGTPEPLIRASHNVMLVLDLSPSMAVSDMRVQGQNRSRLSVVKQAAEEFIQHRINDNIGLVLFGEQAYLQTPLTHDHANLLLRLADATAGLAGQSTSIGDALGLAIKHLKHVPIAGRVIILLTDGANNSGILTPLKAAELARDERIKIHTIGLGQDPNAQTFNGLLLSMNTAAELDEETLKKIAAKTGGHYFRATNLASLQTIYQAIHQMETVQQPSITLRPERDYYAWPLALAFVWLMYLRYTTTRYHLRNRQ